MLDNGNPVTIIALQPEAVHEAGHTKGILSMPWKSRISLEDGWSLPTEKSLVTWCDCGPGETDSGHTGARLIESGCDNVKVAGDPSMHDRREAGYPAGKRHIDTDQMRETLSFCSGVPEGHMVGRITM